MLSFAFLYLGGNLNSPRSSSPEIIHLDEEPLKSPSSHSQISLSSSSDVQHLDMDADEVTTPKESSQLENSMEKCSVPTTDETSDPRKSVFEQPSPFSISNIVSQSDSNFNSTEIVTWTEHSDKTSSERNETNSSTVAVEAVAAEDTVKLATQNVSNNSTPNNLPIQNYIEKSLGPTSREDTLHNEMVECFATNDKECLPPTDSVSCLSGKDISKDCSPTEVSEVDGTPKDVSDTEDNVNPVNEKEGTETLRSTLQKKENDCNSISAMISEKVILTLKLDKFLRIKDFIFGIGGNIDKIYLYFYRLMK